MAIKDLGKGIKTSLHDTIDTVKAKAKEVEFPNVTDVSEKTSEHIKKLFKKATESSLPAENTPSMHSITNIPVRSAIKIIYFLMAADGDIFHGEEEKFDAIGKELDPDFYNFKEQIIQECKASLNRIIDTEDYYYVLQDGAENALCTEYNPEEPVISPKHLVWDLLSIAYSDGHYNDAERRFLKHIVRKFDIDKAVFLEMESSMLTIMDIEQELTWIKTTNRPYLVIEAMVNELLVRKKVVSESVVSLITL